MSRGKRTKKVKYSKFIVALIVLLNTAFAFATLYVFLKTSNEPTALIAAWFAFTTGELWILKDIKKSKIKEVAKNEDRLEEKADEP